jgi:hypothetical protein
MIPGNMLAALVDFLWLSAPAIAIWIYVKLAWRNRDPAMRTAGYLLKASAASLLLCVLLLCCSLVAIFVFPDAPLRNYFGLAYPHPPGPFALAAFTCALLAVLFAVHATAKRIANGRWDR